MLDYAKLEDHAVKAEIDRLTVGYADKAQFFIEKLAQGVGMIATACYPKDVIVRLSDFKSNEYANLIGGRQFEPAEENPMLGFRGASRYYDPRYREGFALECRAVRRARDEIGLGNIAVMVPFCRTPKEADRVLAVMAEHGLRRGEDGLRVYVMCEIPSNVVLAEEFAARFDGFSIGSNDLTQLVLGVDRDSAELRELFDERDEAVKRMIRNAKKRGYVTYEEVNQVLPSEEVSPEQIEDTMAMLSEMGINVVDNEEEGEAAEDERAQPVGRQHLGAHLGAQRGGRESDDEQPRGAFLDADHRVYFGTLVCKVLGTIENNRHRISDCISF